MRPSRPKISRSKSSTSLRAVRRDVDDLDLEIFGLDGLIAHQTDAKPQEVHDDQKKGREQEVHDDAGHDDQEPVPHRGRGETARSADVPILAHYLHKAAKRYPIDGILGLAP